MSNNHIIAMKVRPQLVRRRTVVKTPTSSSVKIIVKPSNGQSANLNDLRNSRIRIQLQQPQPQIPQDAAVSKQHIINKNNHKKSKVKYISNDITADSLTKIKQLKNHGINKILIIIGNGPSINEAPLEQFKNHPNIHTLSINRPDDRIWPTTHWAFFDQSQMRRHEDLWNGYNGLIFNSTGIKKQKATSLQVKNLGGKGFSRDLTKGLHIGRSSVFAAMQIGHWLNYHHIYIFGCDMNPNGMNGQLHFYGTNPDVNPDVRKERFKKEAEWYDYAADILNENERKKYTFCSSENHWGFVDKFNKMDHKIAVPIIVSHADKLRLDSM